MQQQGVFTLLRDDPQRPERGMGLPVPRVTEPQRQRKSQLRRLLPLTAKAQLPALARLSGGGSEPERRLGLPGAILPGCLFLGEGPELRLFGGQQGQAAEAQFRLFADQKLAADRPQRAAALRPQMPYAVGEQAGGGRIGPVAAQLPALLRSPGRPFLRAAQLPTEHRAALGDALLEKQAAGAHRGVGQKAAQDTALTEGVGGGQHAHAHVMGHAASHQLALVPAAARGREVERLVKAEAPARTEALQPPEIPDRGRSVDRESQKARVGGDDHVRLLPAPERQRSAAAGLVAVMQRGVERVKGALGDAPGLAREDLPPLRVDAEARAFVQQAAALVGQEQRRHQVFEHRARPAREAAEAVLLQLRAAQAPPVPHRRLAPGDGQIACQHGLARHQVVPAAEAAPRLRVEADIEQAAIAVVEQREIHCAAERLDAPGERRLAVFEQRLPQGGERRAEVAAVHGGEHCGRQGSERARVVPVEEMPPVARHPLQRVQHPRDAARQLLAGKDLQIAGSGEGQEA